MHTNVILTKDAQWHNLTTPMQNLSRETEWAYSTALDPHEGTKIRAGMTQLFSRLCQRYCYSYSVTALNATHTHANKCA